MTATNKHFRNLIASVTVIFLVLIMFLSIHIIPTGYTGVLVHLGQIDERPIQSGGFIFTTPFIERLYRVNNKQQDFHVSNKIWGETADKTPVYASDVTVSYTIAANRWIA